MDMKVKWFGFVLILAVCVGTAVAGTAAGERAADEYFLRPRDVVLFLGNSITQMAKPELDFLAADLTKRYPALAEGDGAVKLITSGIGGEEAGAGANRLKKLLDQHHPTVCVVGYGTCEVTHGREAGYTPAMKAILKQLKAAGVAVTVVSAPPSSPKINKWPAQRFIDGLPGVVEQARQLAADEGARFVDAFAALSAVKQKNGKELTVDGIHLNADGYRAMADALQEAWGFGKPLQKLE